MCTGRCNCRDITGQSNEGGGGLLSLKWHICIKVQGTSWKRDGKNVRVGRKEGCCLLGMTWLCHVGTDIACYGDGDTHEAPALPQDLRAVNG